MILYHFPYSPFARRVRLALSLKGLSAELRDARADAEHAAALKRLNPVHTVPVLVDGDRTIVDSHAILEHLDAKVPAPPLWPSARAEAFEVVALADAVAGVVVDLGFRYPAIAEHASFPSLRDEYVLGRAQGALDRLAARAAAAKGAFFDDRWSAADIAVYTLVAWLEGLPGRYETFPPSRRMVALGWTVPPALSAWAAQWRTRDDVRALG